MDEFPNGQIEFLNVLIGSNLPYMRPSICSSSDIRNLVEKGSERPFDEITNNVKWDTANGGNADKAPLSIWIVVEFATRLPTVLCAEAV
jgi:hypothetical protein